MAFYKVTGWLLTASILAGLVLLPYYADARHERDLAFPQTAHQWQQPSAVTAAFPQPVSATQWSLDFIALEQPLWRALQQHGDDAITESWLATLDSMIAVLPESVSAQQWQRLQFLLLKSVPGEQGRQLAELLPRYYRYRADWADLQQQPARFSGIEQLKFRRQQVQQLRAEVLGAAWHKRLFSVQERTAWYLLQRMQLRNDRSLGEEERRQRLKALDHEYGH